MEWVALIVWAIVVALALPLGLGAILGRVSLGVQALAALGGLGLTIVVCIEGLVEPVAWTAVGLAGLGILATGAAAIGLSSAHGGALAEIDIIEEQQAGLAGAQIVLFALVLLLTLLVALNIGLAK